MTVSYSMAKEIELIYRDLHWLENTLKRIVVDCQADTGYSTLFLE